MQDTQFFFGEEPDRWSDVPGVRLVLPEHLVSVPHQYFEVLVNCDCLPEMAAETAREYIQKIPLLCKRFFYKPGSSWENVASRYTPKQSAGTRKRGFCFQKTVPQLILDSESVC